MCGQNAQLRIVVVGGIIVRDQRQFSPLSADAIETLLNPGEHLTRGLWRDILFVLKGGT